jgi:hypothetical protein
MIKPGDWVKHPKIEQVMHVDRIDEATAWLRSPSPDGWVFPVWFALPLAELKLTGRPTAPPAPAQPFEEAPW